MTGRDLRRLAERLDLSDMELAVALGYPRTKNSQRMIRRYYALKDGPVPPGVDIRVKKIDASDRHG